MKAEVVTVNVGKNGVTDELAREVATILEKNKIVKIRLLASARRKQDRKMLAAQLLIRIPGKLRSAMRGNTITLTK